MTASTETLPVTTAAVVDHGAGSDVGAATFSQRVVARVAGWLAGPGLSRRRFLARSAVVGSALAVHPVDYVLRPTPAYGLVTDCGSANRCGDGWTAFCATLSRGSNTCPPGSYVAGWWKVDGTSFCPDPDGSPGTRYYIDCNRLPSASCSATCSGNACDGRAVCRNNFRYGQCNQQIRGVTQVVCRVITCAPPWEYDPTCTTTVRTDNNTRTHTSPWLAPRNASRIRLRWQDMGQTGSALGAETMSERDGAGDGRIAGYVGGYLAWSPDTGVHEVRGAIANRYAAMGLTESVLGYPTTGDRAVGDDRGRFTRFQSGTIYWTSQLSAHEVTRGIAGRYAAEGGPTGWLGYPVRDEREVPAGRVRSDFEADWSIVWDPGTDETRLVPVDVPMPDDGSWPVGLPIERWAGATREATAAAVAAEVFNPGVAVAYVARSGDFADALTGGVAAAVAGGPLLLTDTDALSKPTLAELERLRPGAVVVLGGRRAISDAVEEAIDAATDASVTRVAGESRYDTAAMLSQRVFPDGASTVVIATGETFADALAGGPAAAERGGPLLLTRRDELPPVTQREITRLGAVEVIVLGGPAAVEGSVVAELESLVPGPVTRLSGSDRYATAAAVAAASETATNAFVVTGTDYPDGLAAGPAAALRDAAILLTDPAEVPAVTLERLREMAPDQVVIIGGEGAVGERVASTLSFALAPDAEPAPT